MTRKRRHSCVHKRCERDWKSLRTFTPPRMRSTPSYHRCPVCGREVCSLHTTAALTRSFKPRDETRRLATYFSPALCYECAEPIIKALVALRKARR